MTNHFHCGRFVAAKINQLGGERPDSMTSSSRGILAQLRNAASQPVGAVPSVWGITLDGIPDDIRGLQRSRVENAVHQSLTLYAMHQRGNSAPMHIQGQPFGTAVRRLADQDLGDIDVHERSVYKKFIALAQFGSQAGFRAHAHGLISQLNRAEIPMDYGTFAEDLYWIQIPGQRAYVQRQWGRAFHRVLTNKTQGEGK